MAVSSGLSMSPDISASRSSWSISLPLVVGLVVSLFQAVTSIQEFTLTFLPKVVAIGVVLIVCGHWMLNDAVTYTEQLYKSIPNMVNAPG